jgi:2-polyprenyl-3-methyl-5-hydroxy-6-metoxy-1,4-benzoquinol methylase
MISIICVFNDECAFRDILLASLKNQTYPHEIIALDNRDRKFSSAAAALNHGASLAKGDYLMFVHQDIELASDDWLEQAVRLVAGLPDAGIAGVAGMKEGKGPYEDLKRGNPIFAGLPWNPSNRIDRPETVQTLDECLLIVPRDVFAGLAFDERTFDGWHCYAPDYCLGVRTLGKRAYVLPLTVCHRSLRTNTLDLLNYQVRLYRKYGREYGTINTTNSNLTRSILRLRLAYSRIQPVLARWFPEWTEILGKELRGCRSLLDLGCGPSSPVHRFRIPETVGVDIYAPYIKESRKKRLHTRYLLADLTEVSFPDRSFDVVLCSEVIEHLPKDKGEALIASATRWAGTKVILTTPNGSVHQDEIGDNRSQRHVSAWTVADLKRMGFKVTGISGLKYLRTDLGRVRFRPSWLWNLASNISQKFTRRVPRLAFQLFAVKKTGPASPG